MSFKFIFATAIVLSTVYSAYCQTSQNSCSGPVCGSDGITYSNRQAFCAAKGNDATAFIVKTGACCDCRDLCYTNLTRAYNRETKKHIATARTTLPSGFTAEKVWRLPCASTPNTRTLYECEYLGGSFLSFDPACESQTRIGVAGAVSTVPFAGSEPIYRCNQQRPIPDHMVSSQANCETDTFDNEGLYGYVFAS